LIHTFNNIQSFSIFFSSENTQAFLKKCYQQLSINEAEEKSYKNCYPFIYYLEHGQIYYQQATKSPLMIQPILLFYGLVHLIKACILTVDPNYPENTSVLAHGVSTRKRKKQQYEFFQDEVRFQRSGLFTCMTTKMFQLNLLEGEKVTMEELFLQVPELHQLFLHLEARSPFLETPYNQHSITIPKNVLDLYHMTENRFIEFLEGKSSGSFSFHNSNEETINFNFHAGKYDFFPFRYNIEKDKLCFPIEKDSILPYPELVIHYLLLYNLSMIARYETEWWSELLKTMPNKDYPFITNFLSITLQKGPFLAYQYLMNRRNSQF
jgi:hypothetical protein